MVTRFEPEQILALRDFFRAVHAAAHIEGMTAEAFASTVCRALFICEDACAGLADPVE